MCCSHPLGMLRSLVFLALLGVGILVLAGPVLGILGIVLPFAIIGGMAWVAYRGVRSVRRRWRPGVRPEQFVRHHNEAQKPRIMPVALPIVQPRRRRPMSGAMRTALYVMLEV